MKTNEILLEAKKQVALSEVDAFVKGAKWILESIHEKDVRIVLEDILPYGAYVIERFPNGSPKVVLGPNLGNLGQYDAKKAANKGLWALPSVEQLESIYEKNPEVFKLLHKNGERNIMTSSTERNGSWMNQMVFECKTGKSCQTIPGNAPYPTRAILYLGE